MRLQKDYSGEPVQDKAVQKTGWTSKVPDHGFLDALRRMRSAAEWRFF